MPIGIGLGMPIGGQSVAKRLGPIAWTSGIPNEYGTPGSAGSLGATNKQVGSTTHFVFYEDIADGSFCVAFWNGAATAGHGEWSAGAAASMRASVLWIDQNKAQHITQLVAADLLSTTATVPDGALGWLYGPSIRGLVGSHAWVKFWGNLGNGGYYSHGKADYANGEELVYGATVTDHTGDFGSYGNTSTASNDHYGPVFIGGHAKRQTFLTDGDSREAGVGVVGGVPDVPNKLYGGHGAVNRLLTPYMAGIDISVPGATAQEMADPTKTVMRDYIAKTLSGPNVIRMDATGINDTIFQGRTSAQMLADAATRAARLGLKTYPVTLYPVVTDATHNTVYSSANDPQRIAVNVARRAVAGVYDPALVLESGVTPGTLGTLADIFDGTHANATGNEHARTGSGYDVAANYNGVAAIPAGFQFGSGAAYQSLALADSWSASDGTFTPSNVYSPEHKLTAGTLVEAATTANHQVFKQPTLSLAAGAHMITLFAKRGAGSRNLRIETYKSDFSTSGIVSFNLGNGSVFFTGGTNALFTALSGAVTTVDDFYKLVVSFTLSATLTNPYIIFDLGDATGVNGYAGDGTSSVVLWGLDVR